MNAQAPTDADNQLFHAEQIYRIARTAIKWICITLIGTSAFNTISEFAGKSTDVDIALSLLLNSLVDFKVVLSVSLTGLAAAWAVVERRMRHRTVERLQGRIKELEQRIDPSRTSSRLLPTGKTNPSDLGG